MAQADAKDGYFAHELADRVDRVIQWFRVARAVREKYAIGFALQHLVRIRSARQDTDAAIQIAQVPSDIPLHPKIERDNMRSCTVMLRSFGIQGRPRTQPF